MSVMASIGIRLPKDRNLMKEAEDLQKFLRRGGKPEWGEPNVRFLTCNDISEIEVIYTLNVHDVAQAAVYVAATPNLRGILDYLRVHYSDVKFIDVNLI